MLTQEVVVKAVPPSLRPAITQQLVDRINNVVSDPIIADQIRDNFISYTGVLKDGKFKTDDYINAVTYVTFKLFGDSNHDAYMKTFPQRYTELLAKGIPTKDIAAYVHAYNKGKLVNLILEQSLVPTWVLNQHTYQKAINVLADLMANAKSEKVQAEAANSILTHLKKPEIKDFQINMDMKDNSGMNELKDALRQMAEQQMKLIQSGVTSREIAATPIIEGLSKDITPVP